MQNPNPTLPRLLREQRDRLPQSPAVIDGDRQLSYDELDRASDRLAAQLRQRGVVAGTVVGLSLPRSLELVVALWGVLKSGGVYLPLDPSYPAERLEFQIRDAGAALMLAAAGHAGSPPPQPTQWIITPQWLPGLLAAVDPGGSFPLEEPGPEQLAYIIYTSGSSGTPKGVMVGHGSLLNLFAARQAGHDPLADGDRVLASISIGFDVSIQQLLLPLLAGACVVIAPDLRTLAAEDFWALVLRERVTQLMSVPSVLESMLEADVDLSGCSLRRIMLGGERLSAALCRRLQQRIPDAALFNVYGPTETCIEATAYRIPDPLEEDTAVVPIGRPLANYVARVLDERQHPVAAGVPGELYLGGPGVAQGYVRLPEQTAERFLPDPLGQPGARLYRTGDRVVQREDGQLVFLGRYDEQLKLRGFRIEPAEIEAALETHPGVARAAVALRPVAERGAILVAFCVPIGRGATAAELTTHLSQRLPPHMLPGEYQRLEHMPLLPNGKLDRGALPVAGAPATAAAAAPREPPLGELETQLAQLWRGLIGANEVGREDDFFALGGHSLLAVQLLSRLRRRFHVELSISTIFAASQLHTMAAAIATANRTSQQEIPRIVRAPMLPLSWAQQRLWFLEQLDPSAGPAYCLPAGWRLHGPLDTDALQRALDAVFARHEMLRVSFVHAPAGPMQRFAAPSIGWPLVQHDLGGLGALEQAARLSEISREESIRPFDLTQGPLIRATLIRLAAEEHVLLITQHHIISDAWSLGILVRDLSACYAHALEPAAPGEALAELTVQYADFAAWERAGSNASQYPHQIAFWCEQLRDAPTLLSLPYDRPRPPVQRYAGDCIDVQLPADLTDGLRALSRREGVTLFMTLLAGWSVLLHRWSGQSDIVVGTPSANRSRGELEPLIGLFANSLALRIRIDPAARVTDLLAEVRRVVMQAFAHQELPFERVVEALQPRRSLSHAPVFQVMLTYDNAPGERAPQLTGLAVSEFERSWPGVPYDLMLALRDAGAGVRGSLHFSTALFDRSSIERMTTGFVQLLQDLLHAERALSALRVLSEQERRRIVHLFNDTQRPFPDERLIHELFEDQVVQHAAKPAVLCGDSQLSYGELNARANRLAHHLRSLGVGPDDRVALCMQRSVDMMVALLGVLKAGAAYVPMDSSYPIARLRQMLTDCAPSVLITRAGDAPITAGTVPVLDLADESWGAQQRSDDPPRDTRAHRSRSLAYVIFTSGSSGIPKGVMIEHRSVVNFLCSMAREPALSSEDSLLAVTTLSFDIAVLELLLPLIRGATVVLASRAEAADPAALTRLLNEHAITVMQATPATWRLLLDSGWRPRGPFRALCGGEALPSDLARRLQVVADAAWNLYGPTETTIWSSMLRLDGALEAPLVPIGRGIANTRLYVLDGQQQPVPIGVAGEIHIAGEGVARGYLNRPELTAERFLPDPSAAAGERMYRTGDVGRWRADGVLEYLGRNDFQIKVRGFRIEPGEIESQLQRCAGVRQAVVVAYRGGAGNDRLVAYVVPDGETVPSAAALRRQLATVLPEHMLPSEFVALPSLPLTPNGKLDRQALPPPGQSLPSHGQDPPIGDTEQRIAAIWQELLGVPCIGREDDFFERGGHSLLVIKLVAALKEAFGCALPLDIVFRAPVLRQLAEQVARRCTPPGGVGSVGRLHHLVPLNEVQAGSERPLFCLPGVDGSIEFYLNFSRVLPARTPIYGLQLTAPETGEPPPGYLEQRMDSFMREIRSVQPHGPYRICGFSFGGSEAFDLACRLEHSGEAVNLILLDPFRASRWQSAISWLPRSWMIARELLQSGRLRQSIALKLSRRLSGQTHISLNGRSNRLARRLTQLAMAREFEPFSGPVFLLRSRGIDPWAVQIHFDGCNGWKRLIKGRLQVVRAPFRHLDLMREPGVHYVAQQVERFLHGH